MDRRIRLSSLLALWVFSFPGLSVFSLPDQKLTAPANAQRFTPELFKQFVEMRAGSGEPIYWYCLGELYSYPDGRLLAKVEGVDTARLVPSETTADRAVQISRKIFIYRDTMTNAVLKIVDGKPVRPIEYPYQHITYSLKDGRLVSFVEQGSAPRLQKIGPIGGASFKRFGDGTVFAVPLFLSFDTPRGRSESYENYDFWINPKSQDQKYQLSWNRFGDLPPFLGAGKGVMQLVSYRRDSYESLPATIRDYLENEAPLWKLPPKDLNEIRELQQGATPAIK